MATMSSDRERLLEYRRRVQARYAPVVTVVTTPAVDASCAASGLTFADLLRPFCELRGLDVPMRHNPEAPPYTLTEFAIRVHSLAECRQPAADVADDHMTRSVAPWASSDEASLARTLAEIPRDVPSLVALARDGRAPGDAVGDAHPGPRDEPAWFCTPWLNRYAARLDRTLMFAEHESVDHPAGMIVAVSADHPDPVAEFRRLTAPYYQNPDSYPPLMRSEAANPDVPKHFVLVHDGRSTTTAEDVAATFDDAKTNLGDDAVSLLPVNPGPGAHPVPDVWSAHAEMRVVTGDGSEAGGSEAGGSEAGGSEAGGSERSSDVAEKGALMSDSDVVAHRRFVERFAVASLIPAMEARLRALNANISATRKGLKNQFKSFWGRSTGQIAKPEGDGGYTFRSAESEIRVAADLAFALRDHDTAAQHYRLLQSDYKADKAWRRLGAAQEALGHALALSKPEATWIAEGAPFRECRRDAERELEQAAQCFARAHVNGNGAVSGAVSGADASSAETSPVGGPGSVAERTRLATRASLAHAAFLAACGAHREAAAPLMRVSAEEGQTHLRGGLLLEAAATEYCRASPPMVRKCAIHLVLAGHRYNQGGFRAHAIRCYAAALPVYQHDGAPSATIGSEGGTEGGASTRGSGSNASAESAERWSRATEHLHFALGRQVAHAGSILAAEEYFRRLLECARRQPAATQSTYLREYLYVARCAADAAAADEKNETETGSDGSTPDGFEPASNADERLPLPIVDAGDVRVHFQDGHSDAVSAPAGGETPACASWPASRWASMEEDGLVPPGLQGGGATWLDKPREKGAEQRGVCAAGEEVGVDVRFRNPLKIPIDVTDVRLACEFEADAGSGGGVAGAEVPSTASSTAPSTASSTVSSTAPSSAPSTEPSTAPSTWVSTPPAAATLEPGETTTLRLGCTPSRAGTLRIVGVTWTLCDATRGFRRFDVRAPRTRRARGANGALEWTRDVPREKRLAFTVVPAMPRLEVSLEGLPATLPAGAAALATLRVRNVASGGPDGGAGTGPAAHRVRVRLPSGGVALPAARRRRGRNRRRVGREKRVGGKKRVGVRPVEERVAERLADVTVVRRTDRDDVRTSCVVASPRGRGGDDGAVDSPDRDGRGGRSRGGVLRTAAARAAPAEIPNSSVCRGNDRDAVDGGVRDRRERRDAPRGARRSRVGGERDVGIRGAEVVVRDSIRRARSRGGRTARDTHDDGHARVDAADRRARSTMGHPSSRGARDGGRRRGVRRGLRELRFGEDSNRRRGGIRTDTRVSPADGSDAPRVRARTVRRPRRHRFGNVARERHERERTRGRARRGRRRRGVVGIPPVGSIASARSARTRPRRRRSVAKNGPDGRNRRPLPPVGAQGLRWTLEGPSTATLPGSGKANATDEAPVVVPVTLRAHNPTPAAVRITFEAQTISAESDEDGWTVTAGGAGRSGAGWSDAGAVADAAEAFADDGASRVPARVARASLVMGRTGQTFGRRAGRRRWTCRFASPRLSRGRSRWASIASRGNWRTRGRAGGGNTSPRPRACNAPFLITVVEPQRAER